jgi:UDP-GlcNAc3NAcA epimerase
MYDAVLGTCEMAEEASSILERLALVSGSYGLATVHRAENTDDDTRLSGLLLAFNDIAARQFPLVFPLHPRTAKRLHTKFRGWSAHPRLQLIDPVGYLDMLKLVRHAHMALTDSGGLQKEAFFLGCPCITLRQETEWVETVQGGGNLIAGVEPDHICAAVSRWERRLSEGKADFSAGGTASFGDGNAADRIRDALLAFCQQI